MKKVWEEDECTGGLPGHVSLHDAWKFMFGTEWKAARKTATERDDGDGSTYIFSNGVEVWYGYDGGAIYVPDNMVYKEVPSDLCC